MVALFSHDVASVWVYLLANQGAERAPMHFVQLLYILLFFNFDLFLMLMIHLSLVEIQLLRVGIVT